MCGVCTPAMLSSCCTEAGGAPGCRPGTPPVCCAAGMSCAAALVFQLVRYRVATECASRLAVLQRRVVQVQLAQLRGEVLGGGGRLLRWRPWVAAGGCRRMGAAAQLRLHVMD